MRSIELQRTSAGFSLVELMVGLAIGMLAVVIMMQVFSVSEGYKRTTTGGDDAQNNGAIALYGLQRDLRMAGQGANSFIDNAAAPSAYSLIACNLTLRAGVTVNALGPVTINPPTSTVAAGDPNTDTLLIFYGDGSDGPEGDRIESQAATNVYTLAGFLATGGTPSVAVGDQVVAHPSPRPVNCALTMEKVTALAGSNVTVGAGVAGMTGGALFNLGPNPRLVAYRIKDRNLQMCDYMVNNCSSDAAANWVIAASNVVSLRAQYGEDTTATMDGVVDAFNQTTPANLCGWARTRAVRLALTARSAQFEKDVVTAAAPPWAGASAVAIDLSDDGSWQNYRYKVFETVVPLRNMAWLGVQAGC
ncbi:MAG: PilW family protein [Ideonella sp.]|nr:PilW family protein [Ideonella sp.]MCC7457798.1 PilW family protein [Nitrospira sp.]